MCGGARLNEPRMLEPIEILLLKIPLRRQNMEVACHGRVNFL